MQACNPIRGFKLSYLRGPGGGGGLLKVYGFRWHPGAREQSSIRREVWLHEQACSLWWFRLRQSFGLVGLCSLAFMIRIADAHQGCYIIAMQAGTSCTHGLTAHRFKQAKTSA